MSASGKAKLKLDKELGQHFLTNKGIVDKIIQKLNLYAHREVIEIGPGGGALTHELLSNGFRVVAIEYDQRWVDFLSEKYAEQIESSQLKIIHADATRVNTKDLEVLLRERPVTLCGNLPYNRGQEIVLKFFEEAPFVDSFVVMLQKEVVDKFLPKVDRKTYGPLSIKMHFLAKGLGSFFVSPGSFSPPPKVDSAVLYFQRSESLLFDPISQRSNYQKFTRFLQASFMQRRKKLSNNLKSFMFQGDLFDKNYASKRAEELGPDSFLELFKQLT